MVQGRGGRWGGVALVVLLAALGGYLLGTVRSTLRLTFATPYQAVLLTNGQVFFGRLEQAGSPFPVMTDVYYVQTQINPETRQASNVLLKRGTEWHAPDRMTFNAAHVLLIEPVTEGSQVAKLIAEQKKQ